MNIAIDVMGGDYAPEAVIDGIIESISLLANNETILAIGPEDVINSLYHLNPNGYILLHYLNPEISPVHRSALFMLIK